MLNSTLADIAEKITTFDDWRISYDQARALIPTRPEQIMDLLTCANKIRQWFKRQVVFNCGIINAKSGHCAEDCAFCAQSAHHQSRIEVYPLRDMDALINEGLRLAAAGATHYSIVTSGTRLNSEEIDTVCRTAEALRKTTRINLCASLGLLSEHSARKLISAGITRYHHNLETARSFFDQICTTHTYEEDIESILAAKAAGMQVCSGGILGMGESWEQRLELAFTLRELDVDSVPINFLNPIEGTRLAQQPLLNPLEALACIALFRIIHPRKDITICGGREKTLKDFQSWVFLAGANGLMIGNYLTTQGRNIEMDLEMIAHLGLRTAAA
ncbi:MAG: biotin synthase BioB [Desulfobacteraceae bacterium]|nr:biotin synthase BioB [Desulfobacteraceae bacterium]